jgi:hypothetical protein
VPGALLNNTRPKAANMKTKTVLNLFVIIFPLFYVFEI